VNRSHNRIKRHLAKDFARRPALDLGPAFCTIGVKLGSSERIHLDHKDDTRHPAWLVAIGNWEGGGEVVLPQLNQKIPLLPRHSLGFLARILAHCTMPVQTGNRLIVTCFTPFLVLKHADEELFGNSYKQTRLE
jgi:hypothetical protein